VPLLPFAALALGWWTIRRVRSGGPVIPTRADAWRALTWRPRTVRQYLAYAIPVLGLLALFAAASTGDPIVLGSDAAPSPELTELRSDGTWWDETRRPGEQQRTDGQHYIFAVRPGTSFSTVVSIRNVWPVAITVLGIERKDGLTTADMLQGADAVENGLGVLVDPQQIGSEPGNVSRFRPFTLEPGDEASLVIAFTAGSCADPAADAARDPEPGRRAIDVVYDVLGWRATSLTWLPFQMTVPTRPGCAP
jgi:hypothetical protein